MATKINCLIRAYACQYIHELQLPTDIQFWIRMFYCPQHWNPNLFLFSSNTARYYNIFSKTVYKTIDTDPIYSGYIISNASLPPQLKDKIHITNNDDNYLEF